MTTVVYIENKFIVSNQLFTKIHKHYYTYIHFCNNVICNFSDRCGLKTGRFKNHPQHYTKNDK